ncbi:MAG: D-glycero-beta-D-manno-heptose 1-phosphate adenylyltransferase [Candidatus Omnitrophica bacterium]|nr:D-glycero-beta-D-manno-heptose 1-phosphate adenylyltransferase [Candidatus Omnitrophota bacterium]MCM8790304.1 D-glycero-beta-D-manno-heptose 1-phosphate adenylyltransferase [Candidatus Omnitrophota bacterium]
MDAKIKSWQAIAAVTARLRARHKKIVFTNGCFDILHVGHVEYLKKARALGDVLIVGLNSDSSVRLIKGASRPINSQADRAKILASLYFIDYVTIFDEPTPERLIKKIRPHILVKGADWKASEIAGGDFVKSYGGRVARIPLVKGYSTTALIKKMGR